MANDKQANTAQQRRRSSPFSFLEGFRRLERDLSATTQPLLSISDRPQKDGFAASTSRQKVEEMMGRVDADRLQECFMQLLCAKMEDKCHRPSQERRSEPLNDADQARSGEDTESDSPRLPMSSPKKVMGSHHTEHDKSRNQHAANDSSPSTAPATPSPRPYQATIEDDTADHAEQRAMRPSSRQDANPHPDFSKTTVFPGSSTPPYPTSPGLIPSNPNSHSSAAATSSSSHAPMTTLTPPPSNASLSPRQRPSVHFSKQPPQVLNGAAGGTDWSPVDLKWGWLFDESSGEPTQGLERLLLGLANYLTSEFEPVNSLVIGPGKLHAMYKRFHFESEVVDFDHILACRNDRSHKALSRLFEAFGCEYHLVPDKTTTRPFIPALTPRGFVSWMTLLILACPGRETKRINAIVAALPLEATIPGSNGVKERLPRQLSSHLFPEKRHDRSYDCVLMAIDGWKHHMARIGSTSSHRSSLALAPILSYGEQGIADDEARRQRHPSESRAELQVPHGRPCRAGSISSRRHSHDHSRSSRGDRSPPQYSSGHRFSDKTSRRHSREPSPAMSSSRHRLRRPSPAPSSRYRQSTLASTTTTLAPRASSLVHYKIQPGAPQSDQPRSSAPSRRHGSSSRENEYYLCRSSDSRRGSMADVPRRMSDTPTMPRSGNTRRRSFGVVGEALSRDATPSYEEYYRDASARGARRVRGGSVDDMYRLG